ncbi:MAG: hypothetical protein QW351_09405 [Candidatus Caldarchaeum sp.]
MENLLAAINIPCWGTGEKRENPLEDVNYPILAGVASGVGWFTGSPVDELYAHPPLKFFSDVDGSV